MRNLRSKIFSPQKLARVRKRVRGKVVFTNGCFDLLHKGHVTYLEKAREQGAALIVAVNSDASTRRLKGKGRPLNSLADRLEVLAALEAVDFVTWFEEDTPLETILMLKPNVLVKGGDYALGQIVGAPEVRSWGGSVRRIKFVPGRSTTNLIKKGARASRSG